MKTTSTFASLLILAIIGAAFIVPQPRQSVRNINEVSVLAANKVARTDEPAASKVVLPVADKETPNEKPEEISVNEDLSYLKFNVNDYITDENPDLSELEEDYSYLKFDVNSWMSNDEADITELEDDFSYLKFDVNQYIGQNSIDESDLPADNYDYLKFDVNRYTTPDNLNNGEFGELPE